MNATRETIVEIRDLFHDTIIVSRKETEIQTTYKIETDADGQRSVFLLDQETSTRLAQALIAPTAAIVSNVGEFIELIQSYALLFGDQHHDIELFEKIRVALGLKPKG